MSVRTTPGLAALALVLALLGVAPAAQAATAGSLTLAPTKAIAGERVAVRGTLPPTKARTVVLQRWNGSRWVKVAAKQSTRTGAFRFALTTPKRTTKYRVHAPRTRIAGRVYAAKTTRTRTLGVLAQTGSLTAPGSTAVGESPLVAATFRPIRVGRPVSLQVRDGSTWTQVAAGTQNASGVAGFRLPTPKAGSFTYRAVTLAWKGAAARATTSRAVTVVPAVRRLSTSALGAVPSRPVVSADGRYVAFTSTAAEVVGDDNGTTDVYLRDRVTGTTTLVSVATGGGSGDGASSAPSISADGRFVAFASQSTDLVTDGEPGVFVWDRTTGDTVQIPDDTYDITDQPSISGDGAFVGYRAERFTDTGSDSHVLLWERLTGTVTEVSTPVDEPPGSSDPAVSYDGSRVAFVTSAPVDPEDTNGLNDVYVWERGGDTVRASRGLLGQPANEESFGPSISDDGQLVAFVSLASNLVFDDANSATDVFVFDGAAPTLVSGIDADSTADSSSGQPSISPDGRFVGFTSDATDLVAGDENGSADVFLLDRISGALRIVSGSQAGVPGNGISSRPSVSEDGAVVVFQSLASNLVGGDGNGGADVFAWDQGR